MKVRVQSSQLTGAWRLGKQRCLPIAVLQAARIVRMRLAEKLHPEPGGEKHEQ